MICAACGRDLHRARVVDGRTFCGPACADVFLWRETEAAVAANYDWLPPSHAHRCLTCGRAMDCGCRPPVSAIGEVLEQCHGCYAQVMRGER